MSLWNILLGSMAASEPVSEGGPLVVDGVARSVRHAELSLRVETETWDGASQSWVYGRSPSLVLALEICVDDSSGQDGALAPDLYFHLPADTPVDLEGHVLDEQEHKVEAWWGNDAPALINNRLQLLSPLKTGTVHVRWTAATERGSTLTFDGPVELTGLSLKVKQVTDIDGFLRQVWTGFDPGRLQLVSESELDFGEDWPEDRRHWMELHYDIT